MTNGRIKSPTPMTVATCGAVLWGALAIAAVVGGSPLSPIETTFLLAPLVNVPLAFEVVRRHVDEHSPAGRLAHLLLPAGAVMAAASLWPSPGRGAAFLASGWLVVGLLAGVDGVWRLLRRGQRSADGVCNAVSFIFLAVGSVWLTVSRLGIRPFDLPAQTVFLAAVHFHFTGFVLLIVAGATGSALRNREPSAAARMIFRYVVIGVICGPLFLAAGNILVNPVFKLSGALLVVVASLGLVWLVFFVLATIAAQPARLLLAMSALSLTAGMALVAVYTVGEFTGRYWLTVPQMARLHGPVNALGFGLCGLLAWTRHQ
jgi:hypothetical protein